MGNGEGEEPRSKGYSMVNRRNSFLSRYVRENGLNQEGFKKFETREQRPSSVPSKAPSPPKNQ